MIHPRLILIFVLAVCPLWAAGCSLFIPNASSPEPPPASYHVAYFTVTGTGPPERIQAAVVTPDFFSVVNTQPLLGRLFRSEDYQGKVQTVMLSYQFWQRRFGANPAIIGTTVEVDGKPMTVVGIMPKNFDVPRGTGFWRAQELLPH